MKTRTTSSPLLQFSLDIPNRFFEEFGDSRVWSPTSGPKFLSLSIVWVSLGMKDEKGSRIGSLRKLGIANVGIAIKEKSTLNWWDFANAADVWDWHSCVSYFCRAVSWRWKLVLSNFWRWRKVLSCKDAPQIGCSRKVGSLLTYEVCRVENPPNTPKNLGACSDWRVPELVSRQGWRL